MNQQEHEFYELGPVWHLCTPGENQCTIFRTREEYIYGMNLVASAAIIFHKEIKILTFQIMSNHFHFILACKEKILKEFFNYIYKKLHRYLAGIGRESDTKGLKYSIYNINNLKYLQTVITYVNRNGYLTDSNSTPFSYEWGASSYFFNHFNDIILTKKLSSIPKIQQKAIFRSRTFKVEKEYLFIPQKGYVSPASICYIHLAESFYTDSHHYFHLISRQVENYSHIAKELGDTIIYTDNEIYSAIVSLSIKKYDTKNITLLGKTEKMELAKELHYNYNASNKQIKRILKLDNSILEAMFPQSPQKHYK